MSADTITTSANTSSNASSKSVLDTLLDEYRARAKSEREKGTMFDYRRIMDTSDTPWGNDIMKASHPRRTRRLATKTKLPWGPRLSTYQRSAILPLLN